MTEYFVSYSWVDREGRSGFGNNMVTSVHPLATQDDIRAIERVIKDDFPQDFKGVSVVLIHFIPMGVPA